MPFPSIDDSKFYSNESWFALNYTLLISFYILLIIFIDHFITYMLNSSKWPTHSSKTQRLPRFEWGCWYEDDLVFVFEDTDNQGPGIWKLASLNILEKKKEEMSTTLFQIMISQGCTKKTFGNKIPQFFCLFIYLKIWKNLHLTMKHVWGFLIPRRKNPHSSALKIYKPTTRINTTKITRCPLWV